MVVAAAHDDDLLISSLRERYIRPLEGSDGGRSAQATLRAYFAASRHVSSAAAALGVKRHTVTNRLRAIEEKLGKSVTECALELELVLRLEELSDDRRNGSAPIGRLD
jgi:DNA-binding PucR family transcriptional regulator